MKERLSVPRVPQRTSQKDIKKHPKAMDIKTALTADDKE